VFTRPDSIPDSMILTATRAGWAFDAEDAVYLPAGFGSHHWIVRGQDGDRRFVTVDDLASRDFLGSEPSSAFTGLAKAFEVARALHDHGLERVVCPLTATDGRVLRWLNATHSIAVFPYLEGTVTEEYESDAERRCVVALVAELHQSAKPAEAIARRETFQLPNRADLEVALRSLDEPWFGGPYAEPARSLLREHAGGVKRILHDYDRLVGAAGHDADNWTITHGEPHSANVLRTESGLRLIDWDTAMWAPRERDLWMLLPAIGPSSLADQYTNSTGYLFNEKVLRLYALWWDLCEIGIYLAGFRESHTDTDDIRAAWRNLQMFIQADIRWPSG